MDRRRIARAVLFASMATFLARPAVAGVEPPAPERAGATGEAGGAGGAEGRAAADDGGYMRVADEPGRSVALEVAVRRFERVGGGGPAVTLVGVAHIGDRGYYRALQELLAGFDLVLYESVKPPGTGGAMRDEPEEPEGARADRTLAAMGFVAGLIELHHERLDRYPESLESLRDFAGRAEPRLVEFLDAALVDAWGRRFVYVIESPNGDGSESPDGDGSESPDGERARAHDGGGAESPDRGDAASGGGGAAPGYRLVSYGADGAPGGTGEDADLDSTALGVVDPLDPGPADDNIQIQLARALSLSFQLQALDYGQPDWRCCDMSIDQVQRALRARGSSFDFMEGALTGTSLPAKIAKFMLGLVRVADVFTRGAMSDMIKVLLIEMLGDDDMIELSLGQFDPAFAEVIIGERNQVVVDDLKTLIEREPGVGSVAVLYGAGHMSDLAARLGDQLGYEEREGRWLRAIEVDLTKSAVREQDVRQMRGMIKRMMGEMGGGATERRRGEGAFAHCLLEEQ